MEEKLETELQAWEKAGQSGPAASGPGQGWCHRPTPSTQTHSSADFPTQAPGSPLGYQRLTKSGRTVTDLEILLEVL